MRNPRCPENVCDMYAYQMIQAALLEALEGALEYIEPVSYASEIAYAAALAAIALAKGETS